jgi:3-oxoadipate enol-lactonase
MKKPEPDMTTAPLQTSLIATHIGTIAVHQKKAATDKTPLVFLHGVYFDHRLWDGVIRSIQDRTVVAVDMPHHGASRDISKQDWTLRDCAEMLVEILDALQLDKSIAVGHSWGSMTILRAAAKWPDRFERALLCNMPFHAASLRQKMLFRMQHTALFFRNFYTKQAARALFGKKSLTETPSFLEQLKRPMGALTGKEIRSIDQKVILDAEDATDLIWGLQVKALALKGEEDYVPTPPRIETVLASGGHVSPLEDLPAMQRTIETMLRCPSHRF